VIEFQTVLSGLEIDVSNPLMEQQGDRTTANIQIVQNVFFCKLVFMIFIPEREQIKFIIKVTEMGFVCYENPNTFSAQSVPPVNKHAI
jgi:hypothetical protein